MHVGWPTDRRTMSMSAETLKKAACDAIDVAATELKALSLDIWSHPELNFKEHHAHKLLTDFLEKHGFPVERKYVLDTAFKATVGADEGPHVAVLCEYDALPEIGHACGHNLIAEAGIGAGLGIKAALEVAGKNLGKLTVLGTPAEENGHGGKIRLIRGGAFTTIDASMMVHPYPFHWQSPLKFAMLMVKVSYKGKASHAAGFPWEGVNALDAAVMAYNNVSCLRQQFKPTWRVHGVITNGGAKPNIIPELAELEYNVRAPTMGEVERLRSKITACFNAAAVATGCQVTVDWNPMVYANMINNSTMVQLFEKNGQNLGVEFCRDPSKLCLPSGSTDMGNVSHVVPSIHPMFHIGTNAVNHTRDFATASGDEKAQPFTIQQAKAMACTAIDIMCQPELLTKIKAEFQDDLKHDQEA